LQALRGDGLSASSRVGGRGAGWFLRFGFHRLSLQCIGDLLRLTLVIGLTVTLQVHLWRLPAQHAGGQGEARVREERPQECPVAGVVPEGVVKLRRDLADLGQVLPRDVWQVVVLIVVAYIQRNIVERAVVRVGLLWRMDRVVLCNPSGAQWVQANSEHGGGQHVTEALGAQVPQHSDVCTHLGDPVEGNPGLIAAELKVVTQGAQCLQGGNMITNECEGGEVS
jgi:hypothetical protein